MWACCAACVRAPPSQSAVCGNMTHTRVLILSLSVITEPNWTLLKTLQYVNELYIVLAPTLFGLVWFRTGPLAFAPIVLCK